MATLLALYPAPEAQAQGLADTVCALPAPPADALPPPEPPVLPGEQLHSVRLRAAAVTPVAETPVGPCLAAVQDAPLVRGQIAQFQSWQQQQLVRLHTRRLVQKAQPNASWRVHVDAGTMRRDEGDGAVSARLSSTGLTVGADYRLDEHWVLGGSVGLNRQRVRWRGIGSRVDGHGAMASLYASVSPTERSYLSATVTAGSTHHRVTTDLGGSAGGLVESSTRSHEHGLSVMAGVDVPLGREVSLSPYARLDMVRSRMNSLDASQGGVRGLSELASVGVQIQWTVPQPWGVLAPYGRVELTRVTRWRIAGASSDVYSTSAGLIPVPHPIEVDRSYGQWALGVSGVLQRGLSLFADYEQGFGDAGVSQWRFTAGLRTEL